MVVAAQLIAWLRQFRVIPHKRGLAQCLAQVLGEWQASPKLRFAS